MGSVIFLSKHVKYNAKWFETGWFNQLYFSITFQCNPFYGHEGKKSTNISI